MGSFYFHLKMTFNKIAARLGLLLLRSGSLGSLPGRQSLLGPGDSSSTPESGLGKILPVSSLHHHGLHTVQAPAGASLHGGGHQGFVGLVATLGSLGCQDETLVISSSTDTNGLAVDESVVSLGVTVGQVARLGGERFLHSSLLQQEAAVVTDNSPGNVRGNHLGFYTLVEVNQAILAW